MDFEKLFTDYKIEYSTKINRGWINVECPFCTSEHPMHLGFNPAGNYCTCWNCGGHNLKETLSKVLSVPIKDIPQIIEEYEGTSSLIYRLNDKKKPKALRLELPTDTFTKQERKYLTSRNFNPKFLHEKYKIVGGGITGPWKYRIIIPLILDGKIVSWTGRSIFNKEKIKELEIPRYKNLSIEQSVIDCKSVLYNIDNCKGKTVVLTEGAFDVIRLGDNFICSFGTELSQSQISVLSERFETVLIMFDNELHAQEKARKFGMQLSSIGLNVEVVDAYSDFNVNDGAELNDEQVKIIRRELGLNNKIY